MVIAPFRSCIVAFTFSALLTCAFASLCLAVGQSDTPSWNKAIPKPTPKPTPKPAPKATPKPTPKPVKPRPKPVAHKARQPAEPLLSVQFRIFKVNDNNSQVEVSPLTVFNKGDRIRIAMKANQEVYLYMIRQEAPDQSGRLFFPDSRINGGQNFLAKDAELVVPSACGPGTPTQMCSFPIDATSGQEVFTMIFSRSPSVELLESQTGTVNAELKPQVLDSYVNSLRQKLDTTGRADSIFGRRVQNLNPADDKIVVRYVLNKRG
jgi:hypothetical protein